MGFHNYAFNYLNRSSWAGENQVQSCYIQKLLVIVSVSRL